MTTVADGLFQYGGMPVGMGIPPFVSRYSKTFFVDPINGADGNDGTSPQRAFQTLYQLHNKMTSGNNDVGFLIGTGVLAGSSVLSLALAQTIDSTATVGTLVWSKNACHLIGIASPSNNSRAKITTVYDRDSTTYTASTFGSGNFVTVSGSGCYFRNISVSPLFSTGSTTGIAWTDTGQRNYYENCQFLGMLDDASAQATGARSLKIGSGGNGEHVFVRCQIGQDTITRTVANSSLELAGATPRNSFYNCIFPVYTSSADIHMIVGTGNGCVDRWNLFDRCVFINASDSGSTTADDVLSFSTASPGGSVIFKDCDTIGFTKLGDTNGLANSYVSNVGGAATGGLNVNPS